MANPTPAVTGSPLLYIGVFYPYPDPTNPLSHTYLEIRKGQIIADVRLFTCGMFKYHAENGGMDILGIKVHDMFLRNFQNQWHAAFNKFQEACAEANTVFEKYRISAKEESHRLLLERPMKGGSVTLRLLDEQETKVCIASTVGRNLIDEMTQGRNEINKELQQKARDADINQKNAEMMLKHTKAKETMDFISRKRFDISACAKLLEPKKREIAYRLVPAIDECSDAIAELKAVIRELCRELFPEGNA